MRTETGATTGVRMRRSPDGICNTQLCRDELYHYANPSLHDLDVNEKVFLNTKLI